MSREKSPKEVKREHPIPPVSEVTIRDLEKLEKEIFCILEDGDKIEEVAENSYIHRNGFIKLTMATENGRKFRLHVYHVGAKADGNIHNHRWDFHSKILAGALPMHVYKVIEGDEYFKHTYSRNGDSYSVTLDGFCNVVESPLFFINAGSSYDMPKETHHRIATVEELTITYMTTEEANQQTCDLINSADQSGGGVEVLEPPLNFETVEESLELVLLKIHELKEQLTMELI